VKGEREKRCGWISLLVSEEMVDILIGKSSYYAFLKNKNK
jgi:hypothetical protein